MSATTQGIDKVLHEHQVDIIVGPADSAIPDIMTFSRDFFFFFFQALCVILPDEKKNPQNYSIHKCNLLEYQSLTLPLGYLDWNGRPFGLLAIASGFQEHFLLDVARAWEASFPIRRVPLLLENKKC